MHLHARRRIKTQLSAELVKSTILPKIQSAVKSSRNPTFEQFMQLLKAKAEHSDLQGFVKLLIDCGQEWSLYCAMKCVQHCGRLLLSLICPLYLQISKLCIHYCSYRKAVLVLKSALEYSWYCGQTELQLDIYESLGIAECNLGKLEFARLYHQRFIKGKIEPNISSMKKYVVFKIDHNLHKMTPFTEAFYDQIELPHSITECYRIGFNELMEYVLKNPEMQQLFVTRYLLSNEQPIEQSIHLERDSQGRLQRRSLKPNRYKQRIHLTHLSSNRVTRKRNYSFLTQQK